MSRWCAVRTTTPNTVPVTLTINDGDQQRIFPPYSGSLGTRTPERSRSRPRVPEQNVRMASVVRRGRCFGSSLFLSCWSPAIVIVVVVVHRICSRGTSSDEASRLAETPCQHSLVETTSGRSSNNHDRSNDSHRPNARSNRSSKFRAPSDASHSSSSCSASSLSPSPLAPRDASRSITPLA